MFFVERPGQFIGGDLEHHAQRKSRGTGGAELIGSGHALLAEKISRSEQRDSGFLAVFGNDREFSPAHPKVKQAVCSVSLRREDLFRLGANDRSSPTRSREVGCRIEASRACSSHTQAWPPQRPGSVQSSSVVSDHGLFSRARDPNHETQWDQPLTLLAP